MMQRQQAGRFAFSGRNVVAIVTALSSIVVAALQYQEAVRARNETIEVTVTLAKVIETMAEAQRERHGP